jgi:hypothetical protein
VVLAIEAVDILRSNRVELPFSLAVAGFSDEEGCEKITAERLLYRHPISPYIGLESRAVVRGTWVRGRAVYRDGKIVGKARGRLVTPSR